MARNFGRKSGGSKKSGKQFEMQDMTGNLFENGYKKEGDKQPDLQGRIKINGEEYHVAAWFKEGARGEYLFLTAVEQEEYEREREKYAKKSGGSKKRSRRDEPEDDDEPEEDDDEPEDDDDDDEPEPPKRRRSSAKTSTRKRSR